MLGREGTLTMWTLDLTFMGSHFIGSTDTAATMYFVDMVVLYPSIMIAVCTMDRKLTFYEIGSRGRLAISSLFFSLSPSSPRPPPPLSF